MTRGELVPDLRHSQISDAHFAVLSALLVGGQHDPIDDSGLGAAHARAVVLSRHRGLQAVRAL